MNVTETIKQEEGWNAHVYPDSLGFATIGWGFLVDSRRGDGIPKNVAELWLADILVGISQGLDARWPPFANQPSDVRDALVLMAYQLGIEGVLDFKLMLASLQTNDRESAAINALNSTWHSQTPARAERVANLIRGHGEES